MVWDRYFKFQTFSSIHFPYQVLKRRMIQSFAIAARGCIRTLVDPRGSTTVVGRVKRMVEVRSPTS
jgi:hypothetical protein